MGNGRNRFGGNDINDCQTSLEVERIETDTVKINTKPEGSEITLTGKCGKGYITTTRDWINLVCRIEDELRKSDTYENTKKKTRYLITREYIRDVHRESGINEVLHCLNKIVGELSPGVKLQMIVSGSEDDPNTLRYRIRKILEDKGADRLLERLNNILSLYAPGQQLEWKKPATEAAAPEFCPERLIDSLGTELYFNPKFYQQCVDFVADIIFNDARSNFFYKDGCNWDLIAKSTAHKLLGTLAKDVSQKESAEREIRLFDISGLTSQDERAPLEKVLDLNMNEAPLYSSPCICGHRRNQHLSENHLLRTCVLPDCQCKQFTTLEEPICKCGHRAHNHLYNVASCRLNNCNCGKYTPKQPDVPKLILDDAMPHGFMVFGNPKDFATNFGRILEQSEPKTPADRMHKDKYLGQTGTPKMVAQIINIISRNTLAPENDSDGTYEQIARLIDQAKDEARAEQFVPLTDKEKFNQARSVVVRELQNNQPLFNRYRNLMTNIINGNLSKAIPTMLIGTTGSDAATDILKSFIGESKETPAIKSNEEIFNDALNVVIRRIKTNAATRAEFHDNFSRFFAEELQNGVWQRTFQNVANTAADKIIDSMIDEYEAQQKEQSEPKPNAPNVYGASDIFHQLINGIAPPEPGAGKTITTVSEPTVDSRTLCECGHQVAAHTNYGSETEPYFVCDMRFCACRETRPTENISVEIDDSKPTEASADEAPNGTRTPADIFTVEHEIQGDNFNRFLIACVNCSGDAEIQFYVERYINGQTDVTLTLECAACNVTEAIAHDNI